MKSSSRHIFGKRCSLKPPLWKECSCIWRFLIVRLHTDSSVCYLCYLCYLEARTASLASDLRVLPCPPLGLFISSLVFSTVWRKIPRLKYHTWETARFGNFKVICLQILCVVRVTQTFHLFTSFLKVFRQENRQCKKIAGAWLFEWMGTGCVKYAEYKSAFFSNN